MFQTYSEVEDFFKERRKLGIKLGLDRVEKLLDLIGNPEKSIRAIHVAGTNGKGSTIQFLQESLLASGYKVGVYTSPSFTNIAGHFMIDGQQIKEEQAITVLNSLLPSILQMDKTTNHPTEYEILTVMAFLCFRDVDIALIETAMGGKEDTTNCFIPILSVITSIAMDHMGFLGETMEEITYHKVGILKENRPAIIGKVNQSSEVIIQHVAQDLKVPTYSLGEEFIVDLKGNKMKFKQKEYQFALQMQGEHQVQNASLAIMALQLLSDVDYVIDWPKSLEAMNQTTLPGRFELIAQHPQIILDSAHNHAGMQAFINTIENEYSDTKKEIIFAAFQDKHFNEMITEITKQFSDVYVTSFDHPRAATVNQMLSKTNGKQIQLLSDWHEKIEDILNTKENQDTVYFITGSMHFVMLVRNFILENMT